MRTAALSALLLPSLCLGLPPGAPMSDFGPSQVALGLYFDHSGQDLFEETYPSMLNTAGLSAEYAPWRYLALGAFLGAAEFDIDVPDGREQDTSFTGYNTGYSFYGGGSLKLATPRVFSKTTRLVAYGVAGYLNTKDDQSNEKKGFLTHSGGALQYLAWGRVNLVLGAEVQALLEGEQTNAIESEARPMGLSAPTGTIEYIRGLVGFEYYFKGKNQPFLSVAFRPTGGIGWHDHLGLRNASISITLGAIATLPKKGKGQVQEEEEPGFSID